MSRLIEEFKNALREKIYEGKNLYVPRSRDPISRKKLTISSSQLRDVFYNDEDIKFYFREAENANELLTMVEFTINFYLKQKNKTKFSFHDRKDFFIYHALDSVQPVFLKEFCQYLEPRPQDILIHLVPIIRQRIVKKLNQIDFNLRELRSEIRQLNILLNYINQDLIEYLTIWLKNKLSWECDDDLQNPIAKRNIKRLLKSLKII